MIEPPDAPGRTRILPRLAFAGLAVLFCVLAVQAVRWAREAALSSAAPGSHVEAPARVFSGPIAEEREGQRRIARDQATLSDYAWVGSDRLVRVPIARAMEIYTAQEVAAAASASVQK